MRRIKVYHSSPSYRSHARIARSYLSMTMDKYPVTTDLSDSDIVILHHEPYDFTTMYRRAPVLAHKYVISCCVWEATDLPDTYKRSLEHVQEVWTSSRYCYDVFRRYHANVIYVPYAIHRNTACTRADRDFVRRAVSYDQQYVYYLSITKAWDKRKNLRGLVTVFKSYAGEMPRARLIVKIEGAASCSWHDSENIIYLSGQFSDGQINALYEMADAYVSIHHAEGWGLTLSDAMIFGKPVAATGYSGNLEFMKDRNSILLDFSEEYIRQEDCFGGFRRDMKWAYPNEDRVAMQLAALHENCRGTSLLTMTERAREDIRAFSPVKVQHLVQSRLDQIVASRL